MCGICAVWAPEDPEYARTACAVMRSHLRHRGPDAEAQEDFLDSGLSLGHRRLSIVDLAGSPQPMTSDCGRYTITFNGEIFNYKDLRATLDYPFCTEGDTETLLALWIAQGSAGLQQVRGQFAFAVWDRETESLSLAVDAFGVLPLYVAESQNRFLVSSSAESLSRLLHIPVDTEQIPQLLTRRAVVAPATPWSGISRLCPGDLWVIQRHRARRRSWQRAHLFDLPRQRHISVGEVQAALEQSADLAITADVEVGVFLSGGIDSAVVAKLASDRLPYPLRAYTADWGTDGPESELSRARRVADILGLEHHVVTVSAAAWWQAMQDASSLRDSPMSEPADPVFYLLAKRAARDVKVVLTGEGADELFGGYPKFRVEVLAQFPALRKAIRTIQPWRAVASNQRVARVIGALAEEEPRRRFLKYFSTNIGKTEIFDKVVASDKPVHGGVQNLRDWDIKNYLAPLLLDRADRMAMANSLEVRPLFLNRDVANLALQSKTSSMISALGTKRLLRRTARRLLPAALTHSRKRGFPIPISDWLRHDLEHEVRQTLSREVTSLDALISVEDRLELHRQHCAGVADNSLALFTLLALIIWLEERQCGDSDGS